MWNYNAQSKRSSWNWPNIISFYLNSSTLLTIRIWFCVLLFVLIFLKNICTVIMYWFLSTVTVLYVLFWIALSIKYRLFKKKKKKLDLWAWYFDGPWPCPSAGGLSKTTKLSFRYHKLYIVCERATTELRLEWAGPFRCSFPGFGCQLQVEIE